MNKKVIKAMYDYIVSKEEKNPVLTGVHFERERCYASDTRLLAIYNFGSEKHADQTIGVNGEPIKGKYPAVDRIFPRNFPQRFQWTSVNYDPLAHGGLNSPAITPMTLLYSVGWRSIFAYSRVCSICSV